MLRLTASGGSTGGRLLALTVAGALGVVAAPALVAWLVVGRQISVVGAFVKDLLLRLSEALAFLLAPLAMLAGTIMEPIARLLVRRASRLAEIRIGSPLEGLEVQEGLKNLPPWLTVTAVVLAAAGATLLALMVFINSLWLRGDRDEEGFRETRESIWSWRDVMPPRRKVTPASAVTGADDWGRDSPVRRAYRRLLAVGSAKGAGRRPSETPFEYLPRFLSVMASPQRAAELVTRAYVAARYRDVAIPEAEARVLEECANEIEAAARQAHQGMLREG